MLDCVELPRHPIDLSRKLFDSDQACFDARLAAAKTLVNVCSSVLVPTSILPGADKARPRRENMSSYWGRQAVFDYKGVPQLACVKPLYEIPIDVALPPVGDDELVVGFRERRRWFYFIVGVHDLESA